MNKVRFIAYTAAKESEAPTNVLRSGLAKDCQHNQLLIGFNCVLERDPLSEKTNVAHRLSPLELLNQPFWKRCPPNHHNKPSLWLLWL